MPAPRSRWFAAALAVCLIAPPVLGAVTTSAAGVDTSELYARTMARALDRAQRELIASREFWVDHSDWSDPWIIETEHYSVRTNRSRFLGQKIANSLEFMLTRYQELLDTDYAPGQKFNVLIFPDLSSYNAYGQDYDEHSSFYGSFYTGAPDRTVATYYTPNETLLGMWITHSATHQYVEAAFGGSIPLWISEGLASYFALYWDWSWGAQKLGELVDSRQYISLTRLRSDALPAYSGTFETRGIELGMLFKYLLHHRESTQLPEEGEPDPPRSFAAYLREIVRGGNGSQLGFARLLRDIDQLESDYRAYDFGL